MTAHQANRAWGTVPGSAAKNTETLVDFVRFWAQQQPTRRAYVLAHEHSEEVLTYQELDVRARAIARWLIDRSASGERVILLYPLGLDFVAAFFGCLYAGVIAVPLPLGRGAAATARLRGVIRDCDARIALSTSGAVSDSLSTLSACENLEVLSTDQLPKGSASPFSTDHFEPRPDDVAFLQYTSGSTSDPKGTMVTHRNILTNLAMIESAFGTTSSSVIVSWLPIFHDMGLIGNVLHVAHLGATAVLVPTLSFIKSPLLWLRMIQRYQADFSGAPNFAYDLCVDKTTAEQRAGLDLSCWRAAFNGAEPVRAQTVERFTAAFAPHGFRKETFAPTYGLAEATLMVSGESEKAPSFLHVDRRAFEDNRVVPAIRSEATQTLVGSGRFNFADQIVAIVDPISKKRCATSRVGEIWVSGDHVGAGYWNNASATEGTFGARLFGDDRRYLRTGDLGFLHDSILFITGRLKDLIIFRGHNLYPQDIELTLELALPQVRRGSTAAFASETNPTGIVVVAELDREGTPDEEQLARAARLIQETHEVPLRHIALVRRNTVSKTTSGKIQRQRCKVEYERGAYKFLAQWQRGSDPAATPLTQQIRERARAWIAQELRLPLETIESSALISGYGVDSVQKVALVCALERQFALQLSEADFFSSDTIDDLVRYATAPKPGAPTDTAMLNETASSDRALSEALSVREPGQGPVTSAIPAFSSIIWEDDDD